MDKAEAKKIMYEKYDKYKDAEHAYKAACKSNIVESYMNQYIYFDEDKVYMQVTGADTLTTPMSLCGPALLIGDDYVNYMPDYKLHLFDNFCFNVETNLYDGITIISEDEYKKAFEKAYEQINGIQLD